MKLFNRDKQEALPKSVEVLELQRRAQEEDARRRKAMTRDKADLILSTFEHSSILREAVETERTNAIRKRRELLAEQDAARTASYQRREMADARFSKIEEQFKVAEARYHQLQSDLNAAFSERHGAYCTVQRSGPLGVAGREITRLADPRIKELSSWLRGMDDPIRLAHRHERDVFDVWHRLVARLWNTEVVVTARPAIKALADECDLLLVSDYGDDLIEQLVRIRDKAMRVIDPLLRENPGSFTFHIIPD